MSWIKDYYIVLVNIGKMHSVMSDIAVYKGSGDRVFARFYKVFQVGKTAVGLKQGCGRWGILKTSK